MNVNFFLKNPKAGKSAIYTMIRYRGKRFKLAAGVSVDPAFWKDNRADSAKGKYTDADIINIRLDRFEAAIKKAFEIHILNKTIPTPDELKAAVKPVEKNQPGTRNPELFLPFFHTWYNTARYDTSTWKKYNTTYNWLQRYEAKFGKLTFDEVNLKFYTNFRHWVMAQQYTKTRNPEPGTRNPELETRNYSSNYFGSLVKCIKKVMNEAAEKGLHKNTEYKSARFKTDAETADSIYLSTAELLKLHRFTATPDNVGEITSDPRPENRRRVADAINLAKNKFLVGAFTALRVSDFNRLDEVNIKQNTIRIKPRKGTRKNEDVIIPIHPVVAEIIASGFNIATPISEQKINKHIKQACQLVGITEAVTTARTEGEVITERTAPKYTLVTTHTCRRSGATNMYLAGIPSISIMKITGHTTERSFLKYIRISQEENARLLASHPFFMNK